MAKRELPPLSDAQLEIMNVIWDSGEVAVGDVWRTLAARRALAQYGCHRDYAVGREGLVASSNQRRESRVLGHTPSRECSASTRPSARGRCLPGLGRRTGARVLEGRRLSADEVERIKVMLENAESQLREEGP